MMEMIENKIGFAFRLGWKYEWLPVAERSGDQYIVSWVEKGEKHQVNYDKQQVNDYLKNGDWKVVNLPFQ